MGLFDGNCLTNGIENIIENIEWIGVAKDGQAQSTIRQNSK